MQVVVNKFLDPSTNPWLNQKKFQVSSSQGNYYGHVFKCLQLDPIHPPFGEMLRKYYNLKGKWLVASLIRWEATHNDVMITEMGSSLVGKEKDAQRLFLEVRNFLKQHQIEAVYHDPTTWLIRLDNHPPITSVSIDLVKNRSLMPVLEQLDSTLFWQSLLTELQMFFNTTFISSISHTAKYVANGIWFWGEGEEKLVLPKSIITDDEILLSMGQYSKTERVNLIEFDESINPRRDSLIFFKYPEFIDLNRFQEKIKNNTVHWHWNNVTYATLAKGWRRLWR